MTEQAGPATESQLGGFRIWSRRIRLLLAICLWSIIALGIAQRLSIRDQYRLLGLFYYATPVPAMTIYAFAACLLVFDWDRFRRTSEKVTWRSSRWIFQISTSLFGLLLVWTMVTELVFHNPSPSERGDIRLVFWNAARIRLGREKIAATLKSLQPACIGLVESEEDEEVHVDAWQRALPGYTILGTDFGGLLAVKGNVISHQTITLPPRASCERFDLRIEGQEFTLFLVDVASDLLRSRRRPLLKLAEVAGELADRPVVIVGDFNCPDDSVLFEPFRKSFQEGFREQGWGYAPTWPSFCPVLMLDQIWNNQRVIISSCRHGWALSSDHRPVICDLHVR